MIKKLFSIKGLASQWICDTIEDLQTLPPCPMGSKCKVIATDEWYQVDSTGITWYSNKGNCVCNNIKGESTIWGNLT